MKYEIKRGDQIIITVHPEGQQEKEIMVKDIVTMSFSLPFSVELLHGDYVMVWGEKYILNRLPEPEKVSSTLFKYSMTFEAQYYALAKSKLFFYNNDNVLKLPEFQIMGNADIFLDLIVANANRTQVGWQKGDCDATDAKLLAFSSENILQALDQLAKEFNTEWWIVNKTIHLKKKGASSGRVFEYGRDKGLRGGLKRLNVDTSNVFSRLYVQGSDQNLPVGYRGGMSRLQLPAPMEFIQGVKYGDEEIEHIITFDDVKPERLGTVTSVGNKYTFTDATLDFDVNLNLLPGLAAKIKFQTGQLAGYEFEIAKNGYNHSTRTFTILRNEVEKAMELPSDLIKPAVGDTFILFDLQMPAQYIEDKEQELLIRGQEYKDKEAAPKVTYQVPPDHFFFKKNTVTLTLGDYERVKDFDLLVDKDIRMLGYVRDLHEQYKYLSMKLSDVVQGAAITRQYAEREKLNKALALNRIWDINRARMNWKNAQEFFNRYFDPEGNLYTESISPATIRTLMIQTGAPSQQLEMPGVVFTGNYLQDASKINWTTGKLVHLTLEDTPRTWTITGGTASGLAVGKSYYIYAKCPKVGSAGTIVVDENEITLNQDPDYFHFWVAFANSVIDGYRNIKSTTGSVRIYGRTIEGGTIFGNELEINLDQGVIIGKVNFQSGSTGYNNLDDKPDLSIYAEQVLVNQALADMQNQIDGQITTWFYAYEPSLINAPASDWSTDAERDNHLGDLFYNNLTGYAYRFAKNGSVYQWVRILDTDVVMALQTAQNAQDTADAKRRIFVVQPYTPYEVGDHWSDGVDIRKCIVERLTGAYNSSDWARATVYDSTQVTIDNGMVTAGTIQLGNTGGVNAGITGNGNADDSVRIWAGDVLGNRDSAPFRVMQDGSFVARKARIEAGDSASKVVISESGDIALYDSFDKIAINLDNDSAIDEGTYTSLFNMSDFSGNPLWLSRQPVYFPPPAPPGQIDYFIYTYRKKGAGIQVGYGINDVDGFSSVGRKRIFSTGEVIASDPDGTNYSSMTKTQIKTTGALEVGQQVKLTGLGGAAGSRPVWIDADGVLYRG